jgi:hypothetical protein
MLTLCSVMNSTGIPARLFLAPPLPPSRLPSLSSTVTSLPPTPLLTLLPEILTSFLNRLIRLGEVGSETSLWRGETSMILPGLTSIVRL